MNHLFEVNNVNTKHYYFFAIYNDQTRSNTTRLKSKTRDENNPKRLNILVIDDQEVCLLAAKICFISSPHNLICVTSGEAGLEYMMNHRDKVDIVILDIMMPGMDGIEVLSIMKDTESLRNISVIISTGSEFTKYEDKALELGANFYLKKPYTKDTLFSVIDKIIETSKVE